MRRMIFELAHTSSQLVAAAAEAMEAMVHALRAFSTNEGVSYMACAALGTLAWHAPARRRRALAAGAIAAVVAVMTTRPCQVAAQQ